MNTNQIHFYLYHTSGCHLCEDAEEIVNIIAPKVGVSFKNVDIADDDKLVDQYGIRIPVLYHLETGSELGWPFDAQQVRQFMEQ